MKQLPVIALLAVMLSTTAFAGRNTHTYKVQDRFAGAFTGAAKESRKITERVPAATFENAGLTMKAFYDKKGELIAKGKTFPFDKLPSAALEMIVTKYPFPSWQLLDCMEGTDARGERNFYVSFKNRKKKVVLQVSPMGTITRFRA